MLRLILEFCDFTVKHQNQSAQYIQSILINMIQCIYCRKKGPNLLFLYDAVMIANEPSFEC